MPAVRQALERAYWKISDVERFEINEAFAAIALAVMRDLGIPEDIVNVEGNSIAHGHPIGATGAIQTTRLLHSMQRDGLRRGLVTMCIGGGRALPSAWKQYRDDGPKYISRLNMTNRKLAYIVKDQKPLVLGLDRTVQDACRLMWDRRAGSVLVVDHVEHLNGIFTGRDAVRLLAKGNSGTTHLAQAMTPNPVTLTPKSRAIDAIKAMDEGDFRHVPVTENGRILGVVSRGDFQGMEFEEFDWDRIAKATEMTRNREIASIIKNQKPLVLGLADTVRQACQLMTQRESGSVLVTDNEQRLAGIFTGRDAVRLLADAKGSGETLRQVMKPDPVTITPDGHAVEALRTMTDGGFRHLPVVDNARIHGVVSRSDFTGLEIDRLDEDVHLAECIW